jgi:hypothetical protein
VPLLPASLIEPLWVELAALIGSDERPELRPLTRGAVTADASPTGSSRGRGGRRVRAGPQW